MPELSAPCRETMLPTTLAAPAGVTLESFAFNIAGRAWSVRAVRDQVISWDKVHEISSLLLGQVAGRSDDRQITLFKLQGTGIMDVAIGLKAYERVKHSGLAQVL